MDGSSCSGNSVVIASRKSVLFKKKRKKDSKRKHGELGPVI